MINPLFGIKAIAGLTVSVIVARRFFQKRRSQGHITYLYFFTRIRLLTNIMVKII